MKRSLSLVVVLVLASSALAQQSHPLLRDAFVSAERPVKAARAKARRSRFVQVDAGPLKPAKMNRGQRKKLERALTVALFDDVRLQVVLDTVERTAIDSFAWSGRVEGDPRGEVVVAVKDDALTATLSANGVGYEIRPAGDGLHEARELDPAAFPDELAPNFPLTRQSTSMAAVAAADEITVDVLVAYTHVVRQAYGSVAAADTLATNAVAATNAAYARSGVNMRLRLVDTAEMQYDDTLTDFNTTLNRFTGNGDGFMDNIHALRDAVGADNVGLLVYNPTQNACGIGWIMTSIEAYFAQYAFNVTRDDCAVGGLSYAHEAGHNFGLAHDRANSSSAGAYSYAYGYQHPQGQFRTIMAYNCADGGCPRVGHFSNPNILYNGAPTGVSYLASNSADAARALNANAPTIAAFRATVTTPPPPVNTFSDNPLVAGVTAVKATHVDELREAVNDLRASKGLAPASWSNTAAGVEIAAAHIAELRNALTPALAPVVPAYTDTELTTIRAVHIQELRNYLD